MSEPIEPTEPAEPKRRMMICPFHKDTVCLWPVSDEDEDASFGELWNHVQRWANFDQAETRRLMALVRETER